jgi:hypothetical protein
MIEIPEKMITRIAMMSSSKQDMIWDKIERFNEALNRYTVEMGKGYKSAVAMDAIVRSMVAHKERCSTCMDEKAAIIKQHITDLWGYDTVDEWYLGTRQKVYLRPRQQFIAAMRIAVGATYKQIAAYMDIDHATVIHHQRQHRAYFVNNKCDAYLDTWLELMARLESKEETL